LGYFYGSLALYGETVVKDPSHMAAGPLETHPERYLRISKQVNLKNQAP